MDFPHLVDAFLQQGVYLRNWSPRTVRTYRQGLAALGTALPSPETLVAKAHLHALVVAMRTRGLTPGGCNMYLRTINSFLTWLHDEGHLPERLRVKLLSNPPKAFRSFSDAEVRRILIRRPVGRVELRAWCLFVCLVDTGVRIDEALGLEQERVDFDTLTITVRGKGSRERVIPISLVACYRFLRPPADPGRRAGRRRCPGSR